MACSCGPISQCRPMKPGCWGYIASPGAAVFTDATALITCQKCNQTHMKGWDCQRFNSAAPRPPDFIMSLPQTQVGCICPPGANRDCENPACPRQNRLKPKE